MQQSSRRPINKSLSFEPVWLDYFWPFTLIVLLLLNSDSLSAQERGDWLFHLGASEFRPEVQSGGFRSSTIGTLESTGLALEENAQFGFSLGYMLTDNWAIEATMSAPFEHRVRGEGLESYGLSTTQLGKTKQVSPTTSILYYFNTPEATVRPYLGLGINHTRFFDDSLSTQTRIQLAAEGMEIDDASGLLVRAGMDWKLKRGWFLNASVWRANLDTALRFNSNIGQISAPIDMDAWGYSITLGHDF